MEPKNYTQNYSPLALYNYKLCESFKRLAESPTTDVTDISNSEELFEIIEHNISKFHNMENLSNLLPILHYTTQIELKSSSKQIYGVDFVLKLFAKYKHSEVDQKLVLQILYQLLKTVEIYGKPNRENKTDELFHVMCDLLFTCGDRLASSIVTCIQLQINTFHRHDLLEILWQRILENNNKNYSRRLAQILVLLIDDFLQCVKNVHRNEEFIKLIQTLLLSTEREERKSAIYLLRKIVPFIIDNDSQELNDSVVLNYSWSAYITVLESLEEEQSHLILPTLNTIEKLSLKNQWINLLHNRLLQHNNTLVVRWTIEHMLDNYKCVDLNAMLLKRVLEAANTTGFYNAESYKISAMKLKKFMNCDLSSLLNTIAEINWKSVPLMFWFRYIDLKHTRTIRTETLMQISSRVRVLQNKIIRRCVIKYFEKVFKLKIEAFNIEEYLKLIESLYNNSDCYDGYETLISKLTAENVELKDYIFTRRLYEIVHGRVRNDVKIQNSLLRIFQNIPTEQHGWFRFMFVFDFKNSPGQIASCSSKYNIDLKSIDDLYSFKRRLIDTLVHEKDEESFVHEKAVDYYVCEHLQTYAELLAFNLTPTELLSQGGERTILGLSQLITSSNDLIDLNYIDCILNHVQKYSKNTELCFLVYKNLFNYFHKFLSEDASSAYITKILNTDTSFISYEALFSSKLEYKNVEQVVKGLFFNETLHGDGRIEQRYELESCSETVKFYKLRRMAIDYFKTQSLALLQHLIKVNAAISQKKPRYFENSHEHRIKLRIAIAIVHILRTLGAKYWTDDYWDAILQQNNQLNITYFFEHIIAHCAPSEEVIISKLKSISMFSPSKQVSIIVITWIYCCINWHEIKSIAKSEVVERLLPLTMGANFQVRLYSQLAIYKMLTKAQENEGLLPGTNYLKAAIEIALGPQLNTLLNDIRLNVNDDNILSDEEVLFVTNAPFEEVNISEKVKERYASCREEFLKKFTSNVQENEEGKDAQPLTNLNPQRKMNPLTDIKPNNDLISYPECQNQKIKEKNVILVASLIDKLPNLGGVARTCEILGIKNLIIHSKKYVLNDDFKRLSMTAEKGLTISEVKQDSLFEFLVQKQAEGYEIVGAEQTANSVTLADFKFPKRCMILLGHEKEGIPANLLSILDHTVEIPQNGVVRSLNVHVTGAIFMWEYWKQHLVEI